MVISGADPTGVEPAEMRGELLEKIYPELDEGKIDMDQPVHFRVALYKMHRAK